MVAAIGHAASTGMAWAPLLLGLAVAAVVGLNAHRPIHWWYAGGAGAVGLWVAAGWWLGVGHPVVRVALLVLAPTAGVVWLGHHLPRARVEIIGGSRRPWDWARWRFRVVHRHRLRSVIRRWPAIAARAGVPDAAVRRARTTWGSDEYVAVVDLGAFALKDLQRGHARIGAGLHAVRMTVVIEPDDDYEHLARIRWIPEGGNVRRAGRGEEADVPAGPEIHVLDNEPGAESAAGKVAQRRERLRAATSGIGDSVLPADELARMAGVPTGWVGRWLPRLAGELGLEETAGGWRRSTAKQASGGS